MRCPTVTLARIFRMCAILTFLPLFAFAHADEALMKFDPQSKIHAIEQMIYGTSSGSSCSKVISFGSCEINRPGGFVIKKPGKYCLREDVKVKQDGTAITIKSSNVFIDLNGHTLSGNNFASTGISTNDPSNIVIQNGTIRNFTINGIYLNDIDNLVLDNLLVIQNGNADGPSFTGGIVLLNSSHIDIIAVNLSQNYQFGIGMSGIDTLNFVDSGSNSTQGFNSGGLFGNVAYGVFVSSTGGTGTPFVSGSSNLNFINSTVDDTVGGDSAFGFYIDSLAIGTPPVGPNTNIILENCVVNNTAQTNTTPAALYFIEGITMAGGLQVTYKNCTVDTLTAAATTDFASSHLVGIEVAACQDCVIEGCVVSNLNGTANFVHGLDIEAAGNNITFDNCIAYNITNNSTDSSHLALGFGILKPLLGFPTINFVGTGTVVQNCLAQDVHAPNGATGAALLINAQQNLVVENNIFNSSDIGILVDNVATSESATLVSSDGLIGKNITASNLTYGILDLTTASASPANNAYYGNIARDNPSGNFVGLPANTPIVDWAIGSTPGVSTHGALDNYSITP